MQKWSGLLGLLITCYFIACDKGPVNAPLQRSNLPDTAETLPSLDSTSLGVYKAILNGNPGHVKIYVNNGNNLAKAYLSLDSLSDSLTCNDAFSIGEPIIGAVFTGRQSSFSLSADATGNNALLSNIVVNGRSNINGIVAHERSIQPVYCYEAPFTGSQSGQFNWIHAGTAGGAIINTRAGLQLQTLGTVSGGIFFFQFRQGADSITFQGGIDATRDYSSGSWNSSHIGSGVFSGRRVL